MRGSFTNVHRLTFENIPRWNAKQKRPIAQTTAASENVLTFTLKCFTVWKLGHVEGCPSALAATLPRHRDLTTLEASRIFAMLAQLPDWAKHRGREWDLVRYKTKSTSTTVSDLPTWQQSVNFKRRPNPCGACCASRSVPAQRSHGIGQRGVVFVNASSAQLRDWPTGKRLVCQPKKSNTWVKRCKTIYNLD